MVLSKRKGNKFENQVMRDLRDTIEIAYKSLGSGNTADDKGDVITRCFIIETKHHRSFTDGEIDKYWRKVVDEALKMKKEPILIYKENRREPMVMFFDHYRQTRRILMRYAEWLTMLHENGESPQ